MTFKLVWTNEAYVQYKKIMERANHPQPESGNEKKKSSKQLGLAKQVNKTSALLAENPKHPGLQSRSYDGIANPFTPGKCVWEAYVQNRTPAADRLFWCYCPETGRLTILAITAHP